MAEKLDITGLMRQGWEYHDLPWCSPGVWTAMIDAAGVGNCIILACTSLSEGAIRGQVLISPDGLARLRSAKQAAENVFA